jgi:hypothetical protein
MEYFVGIDVSLDQSSICVVDATGKLVREAKATSDPEVITRALVEFGCRDARVGLEAGALSEWLHGGLTGAGLDAVLLETHDALKCGTGGPSWRLSLGLSPSRRQPRPSHSLATPPRIAEPRRL